MTIRVYQFGCLAPDHVPDEAEEQLRLANRFWNAMVEADRKAQAANEALWAQQEPIQQLDAQIQPLEERLSALRDETKRAKQSARRATVPKERREQMRTIAAQLKELRALRAEKKRELKPEMETRQAAIWDEQKAAIKEARQFYAEQGSYWGTYNERAAHFRVASQLAHKSNAQLHFRRFDGQGVWTVQIQTAGGQEPATMRDLTNPASRIRHLVRLSAEENVSESVQNRRRYRPRAMLHMRIASSGREPVWMRLPIILHRPIPEGAAIKQVQLKRERVGKTWRYSVSLTVDEPATEPTSARYAVAVDLGWRRRDNGLRAAMVVAEHDLCDEHEITLPDKIVTGFALADRLRSYRDERFNIAVAALRQWLAAQTETPAWLAEKTDYIAQWKSHKRLLDVVETWYGNRFGGDEEVYGVLLAWRQKERHLWDYEVHLRDRLTRWRREEYRKAAARLASSYETLVLEDMDLRELAKRPKAEEGDTYMEQRSRKGRTVTAPGVLRSALELAFRARGRDVQYRDAKNTTRMHAACGRLLDADFAADVRVYCPHCEVWFDQDANACRNLLRAFAASREAEVEPEN